MGPIILLQYGGGIKIRKVLELSELECGEYKELLVRVRYARWSTESELMENTRCT